MILDSIMSRQVVTVSMDDTLMEVRRLLSVYQIHHVVVVDHRKVVGIVSDRDILAHLSPFVGTATERTVDAACLGRKVHQIMTRKLIVGTPATTVPEAAQLILKHGVSCLPVVGLDWECLGVVTWRDLLRCAYPLAKSDTPAKPNVA